MNTSQPSKRRISAPPDLGALRAARAARALTLTDVPAAAAPVAVFPRVEAVVPSNVVPVVPVAPLPPIAPAAPYYRTPEAERPSAPHRPWWAIWFLAGPLSFFVGYVPVWVVVVLASVLYMAFGAGDYDAWRASVNPLFGLLVIAGRIAIWYGMCNHYNHPRVAKYVLWVAALGAALWLWDTVGGGS